MGLITRSATAAGLLLLLVAAAVIALPSQVTAAPTHHSYTHKGWTATWSQADYDDLQVSRTPDKEDS